MAYKFQFGTARLSGALQQEGHIQVASASQDVIGVATELGASDYFAQMKYSAADSGGIMELADSNGATVFFAGSILSGSAMNTLAHEGLSFTQASGQLAVNVDDSSIEIDTDSLRVKADGITPSMINIFDDALAATDTHILIADGTDYSSFAMSGEATLSNAGVLTVSDNVIDEANLMASVAGLGISGGNGTALALDFSELADEAIASGDRIAFRDAGDDGMHAETVDDLATLFAGDGLSATNAVLAVNVSGAVKLASDTVGISGSIAGAGLAYAGGVDSISALSLDFNELASAVVNVADDSLVFIDADGNVSRQDSFADYATAIAGDGLAASAGVLAVNVSGAVKLASDTVGITGSIAGAGIAYAGGVDSISALAIDMSEFSSATPAASDTFLTLDSDGSTEQLTTTDALATLFAGNGLSAASAVMALDLNELSAAAVNVANDSIAIVDADDNSSKKESIADLVTAMAGAGLTATSGVLSVQSNNVALKADTQTLVEGFNYFADASADATVTLPAASEIGDGVRIKAGNLTNGANIIINRAGSQTIDGTETSTRLESPYGAISMVYVASNAWRLF